MISGGGGGRGGKLTFDVVGLGLEGPPKTGGLGGIGESHGCRHYGTVFGEGRRC